MFEPDRPTLAVSHSGRQVLDVRTGNGLPTLGTARKRLRVRGNQRHWFRRRWSTGPRPLPGRAELAGLPLGRWRPGGTRWSGHARTLPVSVAGLSRRTDRSWPWGRPGAKSTCLPADTARKSATSVVISPSAIGTMAFSEDGERLAAGAGSPTILIWDVRRAMAKARLAPAELKDGESTRQMG